MLMKYLKFVCEIILPQEAEFLAFNIFVHDFENTLFLSLTE